jgi:2-phosphoglycolate phosphatase
MSEFSSLPEAYALPFFILYLLPYEAHAPPDKMPWTIAARHAGDPLEQITVTTPQLAIHAVLFDFDGTLGDSYPAITASVNHVRANRGLPPLTVDQVRPCVGRGAERLMEATVGRDSVAENVAAYRDHHPSVMRAGTRLLPGAVKALREIRRLGLRAGVCSNKPVAFTRELLDWLHVADYFAVVLGPEDVARPKPAPDMLLEGLRRLSVPASRALYIGDMVVDIETARAAGVAVWVVPTGSDDEKTLAAAKPDRLLHGLGELADALAR